MVIDLFTVDGVLIDLFITTTLEIINKLLPVVKSIPNPQITLTLCSHVLQDLV